MQGVNVSISRAEIHNAVLDRRTGLQEPLLKYIGPLLQASTCVNSVEVICLASDVEHAFSENRPDPLEPGRGVKP